MKQKLSLTILVVFVILLLSGCAIHSSGNTSDPPGFLKGLVHGFIMLFSFIASLFTEYEIYAYPNNGGWYNFGYLLGVMLFFGGGGAGTKKKR